MKCEYFFEGKKCSTLFCYICGETIGVSQSLFSHNSSNGNKPKCVAFLFKHPLFDACYDCSSFFQFYRSLRLLREVKRNAIKEYGERAWITALQKTENLLVSDDPRFNYLKAIDDLSIANPEEYPDYVLP